MDLTNIGKMQDTKINVKNKRNRLKCIVICYERKRLNKISHSNLHQNINLRIYLRRESLYNENFKTLNKKAIEDTV